MNSHQIILSVVDGLAPRSDGFSMMGTDALTAKGRQRPLRTLGFLCVAIKCFKGLCVLPLIPLFIKAFKHVPVHPIRGTFKQGRTARGASGISAPHSIGSVSSAPSISSSGASSCAPASSVSFFGSSSSSSTSAFGGAGYCGVGSGATHSLCRLLGVLAPGVNAAVGREEHLFRSDKQQ